MTRKRRRTAQGWQRRNSTLRNEANWIVICRFCVTKLEQFKVSSNIFIERANTFVHHCINERNDLYLIGPFQNRFAISQIFLKAHETRRELSQRCQVEIRADTIVNTKFEKFSTVKSNFFHLTRKFLFRRIIE